MAGPIIVSGQETASNTDILQGTRLQTVPRGGTLTFQLQASAAVVGTNDHSVSIQLPNGDTPMNGVFAPADASGSSGVIDDRTAMIITVPIGQGGHAVFSTVETGTSVLSWRCTYTPNTRGMLR